MDWRYCITASSDSLPIFCYLLAEAYVCKLGISFNVDSSTYLDQSEDFLKTHFPKPFSINTGCAMLDTRLIDAIA